MNIETLIFPYDYITISFIIIMIIISTLKGFINSLLGLLTWIGSIIITIYTYEILSNYFDKQLLKINLFNEYDYLTNILSIIVSIPLIFLVSIFILRRLRRFITSDLDKNFIGVILDKTMGFLYGLLFSYIILSATLIIMNRFNLNKINEFIKENSIIVNNINSFNDKYINIINNKNKKNVN